MERPLRQDGKFLVNGILSLATVGSAAVLTAAARNAPLAALAATIFSLANFMLLAKNGNARTKPIALWIFSTVAAAAVVAYGGGEMQIAQIAFLAPLLMALLLVCLIVAKWKR